MNLYCLLFYLNSLFAHFRPKIELGPVLDPVFTSKFADPSIVAIKFGEHDAVLIGGTQRYVYFLDLGTYILTRGPDLLCARSGTVAAVLSLGGVPHLVAIGGLKKLSYGGVGPMKVEILNLQLPGLGWSPGKNVFCYVMVVLLFGLCTPLDMFIYLFFI